MQYFRLKIYKCFIKYLTLETKYHVIKHTLKKLMNWKLTTNPDDQWDLYWSDNNVTSDFLGKMQDY